LCTVSAKAFCRGNWVREDGAPLIRKKFARRRIEVIVRPAEVGNVTSTV